MDTLTFLPSLSSEKTHPIRRQTIRIELFCELPQTLQCHTNRLRCFCLKPVKYEHQMHSPVRMNTQKICDNVSGAYSFPSKNEFHIS